MGKIPTSPLLGVESSQLLCFSPSSNLRNKSLPCPGVHLETYMDFILFPSQLDSIPVKHSALSLISVILKRALKTVDHCLDKEAWQDSGVYTAEMMEEFVQLFREALSKVRAGPCLSFCCRPLHQIQKKGLPWERGWEPRSVSS